MHLSAFLELALRTLQSGGSSIPTIWSEFSRMIAALALTALWQGVTLALGMALCLRLAPRSPARHRFALWAAGFGAVIALQVMPLISPLIPIHIQTIDSSVAPISAIASSHPLLLSAAWSFVIAALWLAASLYRATDLALHSLHLRKLWKAAVPVEIDPASLPRSSDRLSHRTIQICTTSELERPSVIGFFAPRILIPDWLFPRLTSGELDQIVLHETEHLRRRDDWTNLLQKLCLVLFPLNPGLAWIERRLCREREMACDDGVIGITRAPRAYAACLASLAERGLQRRAGMLSLGAWHARPELVRRVHSILRRKHALRPLAARAVVGAVGCFLLAGATALARCPRLIAFEPARSPAASPLATADHVPVRNGHGSAWKAQDSSAQDFAALDERESSSERRVAKKTHGLLAGDSTASKEPGQIAGNRTALKEHGFSRAEADAKASSALAPEVNTLAALTPSNPPQAAPSSAAGLTSFAAENPAPLPGHAAGEDSVRSSGFIMMSTWETFEVASPENCRNEAQSKAGGCNDSVRVAGAADALAGQRIKPRITVSRMYLKIYSAGDKGSTWLVIQL